MMVPSKMDNFDPVAKLELRRHFLRKYHADDPPHVLDCCQGSGLLWTALRREFAVASYWGVDVKPRKGRVKLDSVRILVQPGWPQNVVDVDTYGSPWKHWDALLPQISRPTTVFLTLGQKVTGIVGALSKEAIGAIGLTSLRKLLPSAFHVKIAGLCVSYLLARSYDYGITIIEAVEAVSANRDARYIGVRVEPAETNGRGADTPGRSEHPEPNEEVQHV